jgi:hypothetical protein
MNNTRETNRNLIKWDVNRDSMQERQAWKGIGEKTCSRGRHVGGGVVIQCSRTVGRRRRSRGTAETAAGSRDELSRLPVAGSVAVCFLPEENLPRRKNCTRPLRPAG